MLAGQQSPPLPPSLPSIPSSLEDRQDQTALTRSASRASGDSGASSASSASGPSSQRVPDALPRPFPNPHPHPHPHPQPQPQPQPHQPPPPPPTATTHRQHRALASTASSFSPSSNHRHSSHSQNLGVVSSGGPLPGTLPSLSGAESFAPSLSSMAVAAAGDSLRPAFLDESALSPSEYSAYVPAILSLKRSEADVDGLYDEQSALQYLREKCKLELKDEAMILALFERTPLGIKPGHFYAWLRLVSWVQQHETPSKKLLFTQTQPAKTFIGAPCARGIPPSQRADAASESSALKQTLPLPSEGNGPITSEYRHTPHVRSRSRTPLSASSGPMAPPFGKATDSPRRQAAQHLAYKHYSRAPDQKYSSPSMGLPISPPEYQGHNVSAPKGSSNKNPFRESLAQIPSIAQDPDPSVMSVQSAPAHHVHRIHHQHHHDPHAHSHAHPHDRSQHPQQAGFGSGALGRNLAAPPPSSVPGHSGPPAPSSISSANTLPLDVFIGRDSVPNPFKHSKPRLVRPKPVVAGSSRAASHTSADPTTARESEQSAVTASPGLLGDAGNKAYAGYRLGDRLNATTASHAPISPLIQAGLNAASQVQRAKHALPPKTYTTIQRSAANPPPVKPKAPKATPSKKAGGVSQRLSVSGENSAPASTAMGPTLVAPQPRRAAAGTDLRQPKKKSPSRSETYIDMDEIHSMRSNKSGKSKRQSLARSPGAGDLLGSHLASLGAGGRPKSPGAMAASKHLSVEDPMPGETHFPTSTAGSVSSWLREQGALARARQHAESRQSTRGGLLPGSGDGVQHPPVDPGMSRASSVSLSSASMSSVDVSEAPDERRSLRPQARPAPTTTVATVADTLTAPTAAGRTSAALGTAGLTTGASGGSGPDALASGIRRPGNPFAAGQGPLRPTQASLAGPHTWGSP